VRQILKFGYRTDGTRSNKQYIFHMPLPRATVIDI